MARVHKGVFTHGGVYNANLLHTEIFTPQKSFYTGKPSYKILDTEKPARTEVFTPRNFFSNKTVF